MKFSDPELVLIKVSSELEVLTSSLYFILVHIFLKLALLMGV